MEWLVGLAAVLLVVFSTRFRIFVIGSVAVVGGYLFFQDLWDRHERAESRERVAPNEIRLENALLRPSSPGYWRVTGRAFNISKAFAVTSIGIKVSISDCQDKPNTNCAIVAESDGHISETIPPGQARDFDALVSLNGIMPAAMETMTWSYEVAYIEASKANEAD